MWTNSITSQYRHFYLGLSLLQVTTLLAAGTEQRGGITRTRTIIATWTDPATTTAEVVPLRSVSIGIELAPRGEQN